jgi:ribosomal protein S18 acetylase RimI-like enzyme
MIDIRYATEKDVDQIYSLGQNVSEFSVNDETVNFWPKPLLANAISSKDTVIIIAEEDKRMVGFIIAVYNEGFRKAVIENIYVDLGLRNQGIGKQLLEKLLEQLAEKKCEYITALVPPDADGAMRLYESGGFSQGEQFLWLDKTLGRSFKRST